VPVREHTSQKYLNDKSAMKATGKMHLIVEVLHTEQNEINSKWLLLNNEHTYLTH